MPLIAVWGGACAPLNLDWWPAKNSSPSETRRPAASWNPFSNRENARNDHGEDVIVMSVRFSVRRIDLPLGEIPHSLKIWNHVDEFLGDPALSALLARNGFRVGVADRDALPALGAIFEENGGRATEAAYTALNDQPLLIPLGEIGEGETYFLHRRGGQLSGGGFHRGDKQLRVEYALHKSDPSRVTVRLTPAFREVRSRTKLIAQEGEIVSVHDQEGLVFDELTAKVTLESGQFLVIGRGAAARSGYLLGSWWLTSTLDMKEYETVLIIDPRPVRIE